MDTPRIPYVRIPEAIISVLVLPLALIVIAGAMQSVSTATLVTCSNGGGELANTIQGIYSLLTVAAITVGPLGMLFGLVAQEHPDVPEGMGETLEQVGLYFVTFLVMLLILGLAHDILGLGLECFFPLQ